MDSACSIVQEESNLAVEGKGIFFCFDRKTKSPILNDINIAVPRGQIYSLLGPSGCGKTTLLKCMIGQHKPQEGSLKIYGKTPGSRGFFIPGRGVGYMPQDLALYLEMTTREVLTFFGALYLMKSEQTKERIAFLVDLLDLPDQDKQIKHLSGGQQRRASFAVALLHKPPFAVLDEPTVGVDPILRQAIWNHLSALVKNDHLTIIITTHYIEEARQAHIVGLMRNGHLLAEDNPEALMRKHGSITLEDTFLKLCKSREIQDDYRETSFGHLTSVESDTIKCTEDNTVPPVWINGTNGTSEAYTNKVTKKHHFEVATNGACRKFCDGSDSQENTTALLTRSTFHTDLDISVSCSDSFTAFRKRLWCITHKNFVRLRRNTLFLLFQMFFPALQATLFYLCIGGDLLNLPIAVTNDDIAPEGLGDVFLDYLSNRSIHQTQFSNYSLAVDSVKSGEAWAALYINPEFSSCIVDRFLEGTNVVNETLWCSNINVHIDLTNKHISSTIYLYLITSFQQFARKKLRDFGKIPELLDVPFLVEPVYGSQDSTYTEYIAPGMILAITYVMALALCEMAIILERKQGLLDRTLVAGSTSVEVFLSLFIVSLFSMIMQVLFVIIISYGVFHMPCNGPLFWAVVATLCSGLCGMTSGFLISSFCSDENLAAIIGVGSFYVIILMSGVIWAVEAMPYYLRYISYCLPLTLISDSLRSILTRGWTITDYTTCHGFLVTFAWTAICFILALLIFKVKK